MIAAIDPGKKQKKVKKPDPKNWTSLICPNCKKTFSRLLSAINRKKAVKNNYCSHSCSASFSQRDGGFHKKDGCMKHKGYILEWSPNHPNNVKGYVPQHRLIMEKHLNRSLNKDEVVHHINHIKSDNRLSNLSVMSEKDHLKLHSVERKHLYEYKGLFKTLKEWERILKFCRKTLYKRVKDNKSTKEIEFKTIVGEL